MTLSEQSAILLEAVEQELLRRQDIVHWADGVIESMDKPPGWVIDLSVLTSPHLIDFVTPLREHASGPMVLHRRIQVVVLAHLAGKLSFADTLPKLFRVTILDTHSMETSSLDERLLDALVEWDCQQDLSLMEHPLRAKFDALFRQYLADAQNVAAVLPWRHEGMA